jgi:UDP-N-acetylglucosamine--N-acetylmuramyl-(pentapeptide) pyrophosphoryl-undecaprenol N-acetylglucosamine transferase
MNVLFAGGGTGGHLYPAIAIADALRARANVRFVGTADRLEASIVPQAGYPLAYVTSRPLARKLSPKTLLTVGANALGIAQALRTLRAARPDIVIATGGYVCFPVVVAARILRLLRLSSAPIALLEPNARPGLTNRLLAPLVDEIWGAFPAGDGAFAANYVRTGIPVRASLRRHNNRIEAARRLGLDPNRRTLLAIGGSLGARSINEAVAALVTRRALPRDWQVLHVSGERDYAYMQAEERELFGDNHAVLVPYLPDLADAYAVSDLVLARSGASTLGELAALGLPSILVPYPFAAEEHQLANATAFEQAGAAAILPDRELGADALWWTFSKLLESSRLPAMRTAARALAPGDPVATILTRIEALLARRERA